MIVNEIYSVGGLCAFESKFRLRHVSTGCYLSITKLEGKKLSDDKFLPEEMCELNSNLAREFRMALIPSPDNSTLFKFLALKTSDAIRDKYIKAGSFVFVENVLTGKWLDVMCLIDNNSHNTIAGKIPLIPVLKHEISEDQVFKLF